MELSQVNEKLKIQRGSMLERWLVMKVAFLV